MTGDGVLANSKEGNGISARGGHTGIYAAGRVNAGYFDGNVHVQGDVSLSGNMTVSGDIFINGADYAEQLTASGPVDPGTVVVLDDAGEVKPCGRIMIHALPGSYPAHRASVQHSSWTVTRAGRRSLCSEGVVPGRCNRGGDQARRSAHHLFDARPRPPSRRRTRPGHRDRQGSHAFARGARLGARIHLSRLMFTGTQER